jgi:hypothetical protein
MRRIRIRELEPLPVRLRPHAAARFAERGATRDEVEATVAGGERFPVRFGRTGFRRNFAFGRVWRGDGGRIVLVDEAKGEERALALASEPGR